ncbi:hypothetical protein PoB_006520300 [Plakobranchus ocellatus]|uniref:Uncharacterized protein n=1 Tax=Plakobranchus ocellatus TaxID=259542 RepID=A0AAV4D3E3_9GAST|nr:hypothetical protein PoB_006520300 [Plakobranchus ocellatus]
MYGCFTDPQLILTIRDIALLQPISTVVSAIMAASLNAAAASASGRASVETWNVLNFKSYDVLKKAIEVAKAQTTTKKQAFTNLADAIGGYDTRKLRSLDIEHTKSNLLCYGK